LDIKPITKVDASKPLILESKVSNDKIENKNEIKSDKLTDFAYNCNQKGRCWKWCD